MPRSQSRSRLPAVEDVAEALAAGRLLDPPEELVLSPRLAREHPVEQRQELLGAPAFERMVAQLPLEVLVVRPHTAAQGEDRPQRGRDRLHRIELRPVAQRAVSLVDVVVERLPDDGVPASGRQRLLLGDDARQLPARLVEDDVCVRGCVAPVLGPVRAQLLERRGDDLHPGAVRERKLALELLAGLARGEHDAHVPVRALVDHEVPAAGAEDVEADDLLARPRDFEEILEAHAVRTARPSTMSRRTDVSASTSASRPRARSAASSAKRRALSAPCSRT